ncbi:MAG: endonuclease [Bacteroidales bacterium]|nr:endonuclease [Bacteroidales bacterium]
MRKTVLLFGFLVVVTMAFAQAPANYYNSANGLTGNQLKIALHNIIKGHTSISYGQIWNAFWSTDNKGNSVVWDMYSDRPGGTPPYTYQLGTDQCGSYNSEGDCYNREHSWPSSWFNDQSTPRTDMHHIFATDGYVNNRRSNFPFGEVRSATWTSQNGSKLGSCKTPGYSGTVFEPIDAYKGDFARAIMYMSVRYYSEDSGWGSSDMTNKSTILPWAIDMLLRWNDQDPVSQKEIDRNNAIYNDYQHNRNPFVDHPEYARMIWDPSWSADENFATNDLQPDCIIVYDLTGRKVLQTNIINEQEEITSLKNKLQPGCYLIQLLNGNRVISNKKLLVN